MATDGKSRRLETKETAATYAEATSDEDEAVAQSESTSKKRKRNAAPSEGDVSDALSEDAVDEPDTSSGAKRKRATKGPRKPSKAQSGQPPGKRHRGKRGLLERMTEMPMDVLFEVSAAILFSLQKFSVVRRSSASSTPWTSCTCPGRPKTFEPF